MSEANSFVPGAVSVSDSDAVFIETERLEVEKILPHALADFGGALSWPIPLSVAQQKEVLNAVKIYVDSLGDIWTPGQGLLEHLNLGQPLTREILQDPARALPALIATARGQALGLAVQTHLNGIATEVSVNEYALAALQLSLDPLSIENPRRNWVAGFDLADKQHWGRPLSAVFNKLREHLITELFSTPEMARLGAYLLLARNAPLYLIKDLPVAVNYGGLAWFNLAVATLTIEAQSPGKVANLNFAQVMICAESAALVDPAVTRHAQTITLIDWGVVQGWVARRNDENYTEELLESLKTHFNDELTARLNTSILLSSEFPSRLEIARAGLKKQFGEHFPIESHVLEWDRAAEVDLLTLVIPLPSATLGPVGKHTLLDVAMMDGSYKWKTTDPLMKNRIHEVNELNLHVRRTFKGQFETTLNNLKEGARLKVQHLISGLPLEDRENLEHGKIDFYQRKTFRLSTGFWGRNEIFTSRVLRLRVERGIDKKVSVYSIDLAAGSITQLDSDPATETEHVNPQAPSIVYATTPFYLADKTIAARLKQTNPSATTVSVPTSYSSVRTHTLANAFVEHLDYDSEDIFNEAEGQTTYDKQLATLKSRVEFLLNLIPFKSAISHFAEGKYLDGAIDLFLDVLGFITAGAGAAAKLAKVATSTASAISKALRAAKIVGMLIIGELNPLSGLPALAVAGRKLLNKGISFAGAQAVRQLDKLRGTPDGFKFLQAVGEQHGPALIGTFKVGDQAIDGVGVLKNDSWYQYNLNTRQLYGPPRDFTPQGVSWGGILGREANARVYVNFHHNIEYAKDPRNIAAFELGYREGRLLDISDYRPKMKFDDLIDLASQPGLMPAEIGALTKEIKQRMIQDAHYASALLVQDMKGLDVKVTAYSQGHYLAHVNMISKGECAGMSNTMGVAFITGDEDKLLENMSRAAKMPDSPDAAKFISELRGFHNTVNQKHSFHMGAAQKKMDADDIIDALETSPSTKILRIGTKDHAMLAGIRVRNGKPEWLFYEPNSGLAKFATPEAMREGLRRALDSGALSATFNTYGKRRAGHDFNVSEFDPADIDRGSISRNRVENLCAVELPDPDELIALQVVA